jgi:L-ribulose-5-phosphate 3-epimerase
MGAFKVGVMCDSFRVPVREGVRKAAALGAQGLQVYTVAGEMAPENLDAAARKEFKRLCRDAGLEIAALCGDLGGHGFQLAAENPRKIEKSKEIVNLAVDLDTKVVTTHIGVVPEDTRSETYRNMRDACRQLGKYAHSHGVTFAIETGPEPAARLQAFLDDVGSPGVGVNMDPANLVMVVADDPAAAVRTLGKRIVHTHAKDGVQLKPCDPVAVYHAFAIGGIAGFEIGSYFKEVPLGRGAVPWDRYLAALQETGYTGFLTVEREVGDDPERDIREAVQFLKARI